MRKDFYCIWFGFILQMTFQACSIDEGRFLYDQLAVVTPILVSNHEIHLSTLFSGKICSKKHMNFPFYFLFLGFCR